MIGMQQVKKTRILMKNVNSQRINIKLIGKIILSTVSGLDEWKMIRVGHCVRCVTKVLWPHRHLYGIQDLFTI